MGFSCCSEKVRGLYLPSALNCLVMGKRWEGWGWGWSIASKYCNWTFLALQLGARSDCNLRAIPLSNVIDVLPISFCYSSIVKNEDRLYSLNLSLNARSLFRNALLHFDTVGRHQQLLVRYATAHESVQDPKHSVLRLRTDQMLISKWRGAPINDQEGLTGTHVFEHYYAAELQVLANTGQDLHQAILIYPTRIQSL